MEVPQIHSYCVIAPQMSLGATYEEAVSRLGNALIREWARFRNALDFTIACFEDVLRDPH